MGSYAELRGHGGANGIDNPRVEFLADRSVPDFCGDAEGFTPDAVNRERSGCADSRISADDSGFHVMRIDVAAVDDDQVLDSPCDEQFTGQEKTEIAGAQVVVLVLGEPRVEHVPAQLRLVVIAGGNASSRDPDLADNTVIELCMGCGVDNAHRVLGVDFSATDHRAPTFARFTGRCRAEPGTAVLPRDEQRRLCHPVTRNQRCVVEPKRRGGLLEPCKRLGMDRLGAAVQLPDGRQVQVAEIVVGQRIRAQVEREVRPDSDRNPIVVDRLQPAPGLLHEVHGRHQHERPTVVHRQDDRPDQPHVVIRRQPGEPNPVRVGAHTAAQGLTVAQQVVVGQAYAFGRARRTRRVLNEGEIVACSCGDGHGGVIDGRLVGVDDDRCETGGFEATPQCLDLVPVHPVDDDSRGLAIGGDLDKSIEVFGS